MNAINIGNHSKIVARNSDRERIRAFYRDVLGCTLTKESPAVDYIRFSDGFFLAVMYEDDAPSAEALRDSIWLELRASDAVELSSKILAFGVHRIELPDAEHLYFQAPGGQVFRVVAANDDLSRFER